MAARRRRDLIRYEPGALLERLLPPCPPWLRVPAPEDLGDTDTTARWCRAAVAAVAPDRQDRVLEALQLATEPRHRAGDQVVVELVQLEGWADSPANLVLEAGRPHRHGLVGLTSLGREGSGENRFGDSLEVRRLPGSAAAVLQETEHDTGEATAGWLLRVGLFTEFRTPGWLGTPRTLSIELFGDQGSTPVWADWLRSRLTGVLAGR